jgi:hypothetical protein
MRMPQRLIAEKLTASSPIEASTPTRKFFNLTTVASGAALGMIIAGVLALIGGAYANNVVHDQLAPQKISFPAKGKDLPANLNEFAGQRVDTAKEAKAYANDFIGLHLKAIGGGKTFTDAQRGGT